MGIGYHELQFLRYARKRNPFGAVATIGRLGLFVREPQLRKLIDLPSNYQQKQFCEHLLLECFSATSVESYDNSEYEKATHIVDMNSKLPSDHRTYDTIIDFGSLEHIYNVPQALLNISDLCNDGGAILHALPASNYCGHGFFQFSPELFFSVYSNANGYTETEVFIADLSRESIWFQVERPENGQRAEVTSATPLIVLCRTVKSKTFSHENVQQSDYKHVWDLHTSGEDTAVRKGNGIVEKIFAAGKRVEFPVGLYRLLDRYRMHTRLKGETALSNKNRHLTKRRISDLLRGAR